MTLVTPGPQPVPGPDGDGPDGERVSESAVVSSSARFAGWVRHAPAERAPLAGIPAVWCAAEIMHLAGVSPLFTGAATVAAAGLAYGIGERRQGHARRTAAKEDSPRQEEEDAGDDAGPGEAGIPPEAYRQPHPRLRGAELAAATAGVGAWATLAARWGALGGPDHLVGIIYGLGTIGGYWWLRTHEAVLAARARRDARAQAEADAAARAAEWLRKRMQWVALAQRVDLAGSHLMAVEPTRNGEEWVVDTYETRRLAAHCGNSTLAQQLAGARHLRKHMVEAWPDPDWPYRIHILWRARDPWSGGGADGLVWHPWAAGEYDPGAPFAELLPPGRTIRNPVVFGADPETGTPLQVPLWDAKGAKRVAIVGLPESGKSMLADTLREGITACPDARLVLINLSKALEDSWWAEVAAAAAVGGEPDAEARGLAVLDFANDSIRLRRFAPARAQGARVHVPTPAEPLFVLMVDECDKVVDDPQRKRALEEIASKCRSEGWALILLTQRAVQGWLPPGVRANLSHLIFGKLRPSELRRLVGSDGITLPDITSYGRGNAGIFGVCEHPTFEGMPFARGRAFFWGDNSPGLLRLIRARAAAQPPYVLEPALAPLAQKWAAITSGKPMAASDDRYDLVATADGRTAPGVAGVRAKIGRIRAGMSDDPPPAAAKRPAPGGQDGEDTAGSSVPLPQADQQALRELLTRPEGVTSREAGAALAWSHTKIHQQLTAWRHEGTAEIHGEGGNRRWHAASRARLRVVPPPQTAVSGQEGAREPDQIYDPDVIPPDQFEIVMTAATWTLTTPDLETAAAFLRQRGVPEPYVVQAIQLLRDDRPLVEQYLRKTLTEAGAPFPPWLAAAPGPGDGDLDAAGEKENTQAAPAGAGAPFPPWAGTEGVPDPGEAVTGVPGSPWDDATLHVAARALVHGAEAAMRLAADLQLSGDEAAQALGLAQDDPDHVRLWQEEQLRQAASDQESVIP